MANHCRETAERLREIAATVDQLSGDQKADLHHAAQILCRLEQLKRDLIASDHNDEGESDRLCAELLSLLGIHVGS
jgi:hypothetical protein